jgi:hypothetical protein
MTGSRLRQLRAALLSVSALVGTLCRIIYR